MMKFMSHFNAFCLGALLIMLVVEARENRIQLLTVVGIGLNTASLCLSVRRDT